jgi:hypothetical protein
MTHPIEVRPAPDAPSLAGGARGLFRWVCTSNPFYVLSALAVCLGLWISFGAQVRVEQTGALMAGMAGYTLLLAVTACLLVRSVGVWDDVRTVLLLVVLMFLATSVTFDEVLARSPRLGVACYLGGLAFAVAVSEGMLRGIRLGLPACFRAPYYLILALFFLYPLAISPLLEQPRSEALSWALFGFSPAAGLVALALLPAARRGPEAVRDNGSPWRWPLYPWTLFGLLGFGVMARSALLCWSMHHIERAEAEPYIFGPYFLVPFLLGVAALLLEIGLAGRRKGVLRAALAVPPILLVLAMVGHRPEVVYQGFLAQFVARLGGTPLYLTLLATAGFYAYAALRRVGPAVEALTAAMAALAVVGPSTLDLGELTAPRAWPLLAVAALQLGLGLWRRDSWRCLVGVGCLALAATVGLAGSGAGTHRGPVAFHLAMVAALIVGAAFDDALGRLLRRAGAAMALLACLAVASGRLDGAGPLPSWVPAAYPPAMAALIALYGLGLGDRAAIAAGVIAAGFWLAAAGWRGYCALRQVVAGLDYITVGLVLFALAVLTSVAKGGLLSGRPEWRGGKVPHSSG